MLPLSRRFKWRDFFFFWRDSPQWAMASSFVRFLDHTQRRITVGRTPLGEWSARRRDLYLTTHNTHNGQTSMLAVGFEPTISAGERPQTYALDRAATGPKWRRIGKVKSVQLHSAWMGLGVARLCTNCTAGCKCDTCTQSVSLLAQSYADNFLYCFQSC